MAISLLSTKLFVPAPRPELVSRPHLVGRLNEGVKRKVTLLSAPAGFGKSTLLSQWAASCSMPVAWLSLDKDDNEVTRFWSYVVAAVQTVCPGVGAAIETALQSPAVPSLKGLLTGLINEIAETQVPFALVLDDLHTIITSQVHTALTFLIENQPPQMRLLLSGRSDPPWALARLRARGDLTELRSQDLRFTLYEATEFLGEVMRLDLSPADVTALEQRTEGWIAGLQMAALSMRGHSDVSAFVTAFAGTNRFILDYLVEEVLDAQPETIRAFLLETSILERLTATLCAAVTGREESQAILVQLERSNLFVIPLDDRRLWYRYHQLFADLLRSRLEQSRPDALAVLYRRAGKWCEQNGMIPEAVGYSLASGDVERVVHLVAGDALSMVYQGELRTLVSQLAALPYEVARSRPWLRIAQAWTLAYAGELDGVGPLLREAEESFAGQHDRSEASVRGEREGQRIAGHIATIRAYCAGLRGEMFRAAELARQAQQHLPPDDVSMRGYATTLLGAVLRPCGDLNGAAEACESAVSFSQVADDKHLGAVAFSDLAALHAVRGQLHEAVAACQHVRQLADGSSLLGGRPLPVLGYALARLSAVHREWNDLESALRYAQEGLALCTHWGQADVLVYGSGQMARVLQTIGDTDGAFDAMAKGREISESMSSWTRLHVAVEQARLWLAQADLRAASRWVQENALSSQGDLSFQYLFRDIMVTRVLIAQGAFADALRMLSRLLKLAEAAGAHGYSIEILVLQAVAQHTQGRIDAALPALERALSLAEPNGYVRTFLDEREPMFALLRQAAARGIMPDYVNQLLVAMDIEMRGERPASAAVLSAVIEPLSPRELEVLRLLGTHLSSREIAEALVVSVNTVRSHIKSIYGKLDVHSRADAIERARQLELV